MKVNILLLEDDAEFAANLREFFDLKGFNTVHASSAEKALSELKTSFFDIIISDIMLPGKDGISFIQELRQIDPDTPVIISSGLVSNRFLRAGMDSGAVDYIQKPFDFDYLEKVILRHLENKRIANKMYSELINFLRVAIPSQLSSQVNLISAAADILQKRYDESISDPGAKEKKSLCSEDCNDVTQAIISAANRVNSKLERMQRFLDLEYHANHNSNSIEISFGGYQISDLVEEIIRAGKDDWKDKPVFSLTLEKYETDLPKQYLFMALKELVDNAYKYGKNHEISLLGKNEDSFYSLMIVNFGSPVDEDLLNRNYYMDTQTGKNGIRPKGLGLRIVKLACRMLGIGFRIYNSEGMVISELKIFKV